MSILNLFALWGLQDKEETKEEEKIEEVKEETKKKVKKLHPEIKKDLGKLLLKVKIKGVFYTIHKGDIIHTVYKDPFETTILKHVILDYKDNYIKSISYKYVYEKDATDYMSIDIVDFRLNKYTEITGKNIKDEEEI